MKTLVENPLPVAIDRVQLATQRWQGREASTADAAAQFEGLLMSLLFQALRKTVEPSGLLGDSGQSRSTHEYLLDQAVVDKALMAGKGWGLAERLRESWKRHEKSAADGTGSPQT